MALSSFFLEVWTLSTWKVQMPVGLLLLAGRLG
jgi:hypothetical protein